MRARALRLTVGDPVHDNILHTLTPDPGLLLSSHHNGHMYSPGWLG